MQKEVRTPLHRKATYLIEKSSWHYLKIFTYHILTYIQILKYDNIQEDQVYLGQHTWIVSKPEIFHYHLYFFFEALLTA